MIYRVIVDVQSQDVDRIFDYRAEGDIPVGSRVVVPFGKKQIEGYVVGTAKTTDVPSEKLKSICRTVDALPAITGEMLSVMRFMQTRYHVTAATALRQFLPGEMRRGTVKESVEQFVRLKEGLDATALAAEETRSKKRAELLLFFADGKTEKLSEARKRYGVSAVNGLIEKGYFTVTEIQKNRVPLSEASVAATPVTLKPTQEAALKKINESKKRVQLLFGVTGSGKTEVYLRLIEAALSQGKTAIMLVPEIALTPQTLTRLRSRFGERVAILHSGLSAGERFDEWWRLRTGKAVIAVGARSAIFAPLENLGVIVVDEEHETSYQSESNPRYFTKEIALHRAAYNGCKLVLGSATPAVESYLSAQNGEYELVEMRERVNKRPLPKMEIADMRKEMRRGNHTLFSSLLKEHLQTTLEEGNQAILFLNRRGYSSTVICRDCGYVAKCAHCDVSLTYHKGENRLKCHYCNAQYKMPELCPECGSPHLKFGHVGTERVVMELQELFPEARILRMDNDTTRTKEGHYKILKAFSEKEADILVGTQMIAKGHDFPSVTLVGVLDADMGLHFSDYRSGERTFQLITQVAGRSGRADKSGKVILQTFTPDNYVLDFAGRYDYESMAQSELSLRRATMFPPYARIVRVLASGTDEKKVVAAIKTAYENLEKVYAAHREEFIFFQKMKAPILRLQTKFRYQILMRIKEGNTSLLTEIYEAALPANTPYVSVFVEENPNNMT